METDWKKKYEEALERARKYHGGDEGTLVCIEDMLEDVFPELRESEDEMIRKHIVTFIMEADKRGEAPEECAKWLAYLEKQKDFQSKVQRRMEYLWDKLPDSDKVENGDCTPEEWKALGAYMELEMNFDNGSEEKQKEQKPNYCHYGGDPNIERCRCCSASCSGRLADEQKPPIAGNDFGWIDELKHDLEHPEELDQKVDDVLKQRKGMSLEWCEVELKFRGEMVKVKRPFYRDDKGRGYSTTEQDEIVAWNALRAWCEKKGVSLYDLYPNTEWSEDNIKELTEFEAAMLHIGMSFFGGSAGLNPNNTNEVKKQAKLLLELVSKQEWSEEDEKIITALTKALIGSDSAEKIMLFDGVTIEMVSDWLKSLRPSWKPSEEQMEALEPAVKLY